MLGFFSAALGLLPLPSLSAVALSSGLQRRLLHYLLKRALGHLIKDGDLKLDQIEAGIGTGRVEIRDVRLDTDFVNDLLRLTPLRMEYGLVGSIAIQIPWSNLLNGELILELSNIDVGMIIVDSFGPVPEVAAVTARGLSDSILSVTENVLEEDDEGRQLGESIRSSFIDESTEDIAEQEGTAPATYVMVLVENLLSRLRASANNVRVKLRNTADGDNAATDLQLRADSIAVRPGEGHLRSLKLAGISVWIDDKDVADDEDGSSTSSDHYDAQCDDDDAYMDASQADLRSSMAQTMYASARLADSMYASAVSEATTPAKQQHTRIDEGPQMIVQTALGESIDVQVSRQEHLDDDDDDMAGPSRRARPIRITVQVTSCPFTTLLTPATLSALLRFYEDATASLQRAQSNTAFEQRSTEASIPNTELHLELDCKAFHFVCAYESPLDVGGMEALLRYKQSCDAFWLRPARVCPSIGHFRLRIQDARLEVTIGRKKTAFQVAVEDVGLYESLSPSLTSVAGDDVPNMLPVLLFDVNLPQSVKERTAEDSTAGATIADTPATVLDQFSIQATDWRARASTGERTQASLYQRTDCSELGWKVRPKTQRPASTHEASSGTSLQTKKRSPCILVTGVLVQDDAASKPISVKLQPVHAFADTSAVNRLLPLLHEIGQRTRTKSLPVWSSDVMEASFATVHAAALAMSSSLSALDGVQTHHTQHHFALECPLVRVEMRVSTAWQSLELDSNEAQRRLLLGLETRSGIVVIDARDIRVSNELTREPTRRRSSVRFDALPRSPASADPISSLSVSLGRIDMFYKARDHTTAKLFACFGPIESDEDDALLPTLAYKRSASSDASGRRQSASTATAECRLPSVQVSLSKALLDGLELMADDASLWSSSLRDWHGRSDAENGTEALRILGSRFFGGGGSKQSNSTISASSTSTEVGRPARPAPVFSLGVQEVRLALRLPSSDRDGVSTASTVYASASELSVRFDASYAVNSTRASLSVATMAVSVGDVVGDRREEQRELLQRTIRPSVTQRAPAMLFVQIVSTVEQDTSFRGSQIDVTAQNATLVYEGNEGLLRDLMAFGRSPEGAFEHVEPNEVTRIALRFKDISILLAPLTTDARAVCVLGDVTVRSKLVSDYPRTSVRIAIDDTCLLLAERLDEEDEGQLQGRHDVRLRRPVDVWKARGCAKAVNVNSARIAVVLSTLTWPEVDVKVTQVAVEVLACADTMTTAQSLVDAIQASRLTYTTNANDEAAMQRAASTDVLDAADRGTHDMLASVDEDAFRSRKHSDAWAPDLLDDDVPQHPDFLAGEERINEEMLSDAALSYDIPDSSLDDDERDIEYEKDGGMNAGLASVQRREKTKAGHVLFRNETVTVRVLDDVRGIDPTPGYFSNPNLGIDANADARTGQAPSLRVRMQGCDVSVRLFGGYDWQTSRRAIEDEAKKVRRRLQKIKQMLDQGQTPDDSVEEAAAALFDSVHVALPDGKTAGEMDAAALMHVVEHELDDDQSETASSASTWKQFVPGRVTSGLAPAAPAKRRKRSKLARSRESMIDMEFNGVRLEYDAYSAMQGSLAARTSVCVASMRILDNIRTSTWRTFLTELASPQSQIKDMVRLELSHVRPTASRADAVEVRCKARISPLRLHVDQDALDFLKKFFTFQAPSGKGNDGSDTAAKRTASPSSPPSGPFIQHADVYAIKLKLDYKPKRVDYRLLREGKTIEMMNFFNFEGSEITLRHITLRGVTGWPKLFELLNDLWTPDVKSNQLADVLSGIRPIRSLVNVGNGVADLILLPIEQYQRDGRLGRGLRDGAMRFVKTTALEAARLGSQLATGTQVILEQAEQVLGGGGGGSGSSRVHTPKRGGAVDSTRSADGALALPDEYVAEPIEDGEESDSEEHDAPLYSRHATQPDDLRQALGEAQRGLARGFNEAAQTILAVPMEVYERRVGQGRSRPVVRAVPIAVLKSAAGATEAVSKTLQGIQRELSGGTQLAAADVEQKYKQPRRQRERKE